MKSFDTPKDVKAELEKVCKVLHNLCVENKISYLAAFCTSAVEEEGWDGATSVYFAGPDRTPDSFVEAIETLEDGASYYDDLYPEFPRLQ